MTVPLYMDHHVPSAITIGLRRRSVDVLTAFEDGAACWADEAILERATVLGRVVFTRDDDFLAIADEWLRTERDFAGIIYAHQLAVTIGRAIRDLELIAKALDPPDMHNSIEFLPL